MAASTKTIKIDFFGGYRAADADPPLVSGVLADLVGAQKKKRCPPFQFAGAIYQVRDLVAASTGRSFSASLCRFRLDDLPHAGEPEGEERELVLEGNESLIEKSYFIFYKKNQLLVMQRNRAGGSALRLGEYLTAFDTETVAFAPVLQPEPMKRLMSGKVATRSIELIVARPTNPGILPKGIFSRGVMEVLRGSGGKSISLQIRGDARASRGADRRLLPEVKRGIEELAEVAEIRKARAVVEDDDGQYLIDLIADRIVGNAQVQMNGRYPLPESVLNALDKSRDEHKAILSEVLGEPGQNLR